MKFLLDMGISPKVVEFLQQTGHQAIHLQQQNLHRLEDSQILDKARIEGCILLIKMGMFFMCLLESPR